ncbi:MAG: sigma-70 family RNA polymerase sigma factor [Bacteroidia bacterium]|nr:sigma-70 family RNA polymerase sigma factor [Bacteroidia bacterium]
MLNEEKLIDGCSKGKRKYQKMLYEQYSSKMFVVSLRYTKSRLDAEDTLQDAFVKVFSNIQNFRRECPLEHWIKKIVINTALKHKRSKLYDYPTKDVEEMENLLPDREFTLSNYHFNELLKFVQQLPDRCQVIFNLYAIEGYQHKEIAEMLKINEGTSKSQYSRAKMLLQKMILQNEEVRYEQFRKG